MSATPSNVFVALPPNIDADDYANRFGDGLAADRSPWGLGEIANRGFKVTFSNPLQLRGPLGLGQRALKKMFGFDILHAIVNRRVIRSADLVIAHTEREWLAVAALKALKIVGQGQRIVGNTLWLPGEWESMGATRRSIYRACIAQVDLFTFNARPALDRFAQVCPSARVAYVDFGISVESFPLQLGLEVYRVPDEILVAGNDRYRDWDAIERLAHQMSHVRFLIASSTAPPSLLANRNVERVSAVGPREMLALYRRAALSVVLCKPNLHASGITVIMESVSQGCPVVATPYGGLIDYFDDQEVHYLEESSTADLVAGLSSLLGDVAAMSAQAQAAMARFVESDYTTNGFIGRLLAAIEAEETVL